MTHFFLLLAFGAATLLPAGLARSAAASGPAQVVASADLDLASQGGVRRLDRRIAAAAADLCGPMSDADPAGKDAVRRCRRDAVQSAAAMRARAIGRSATATAQR